MDPKAAALALGSPDFGVGANPVLQVDPMANALQQQGGVGLPASTVARPVVSLDPLHQTEGALGGTATSYGLMNAARKYLGGMDVDFDPATGRLNIQDVRIMPSALKHFGKTYDPKQSMYDQAPNLLGPANMRSMLRALLKDYPETTTIIGERVSGAREKSGASPWVTIPIKKPKSE